MPPIRPHYLAGPTFQPRMAALGNMPASRYPHAAWWVSPLRDLPFVPGMPVLPPGYGRVYGAGMDPITAIANVATSLNEGITQIIQGKQQKAQSMRDAAMQTQQLQAQQQLALVGQHAQIASATSQERMTTLAVGGTLAVTTILGAILLLKKSSAPKKNPRRRNPRKHHRCGACGR